MRSRLRNLAESISAALLLALFLTFLLQIFSRYVLSDPFGWTLELCLSLWIWVVFWGNAFIVDNKDHVRFDLIYQESPGRIRRLFGLVSAIAIAIAMAISIYPTWDYIDFMQIQKSPSLQIPFKTIFSVYLVFLVAVALSYGWRSWLLMKGTDPDGDSA
ncbi:MAG: TRAP transporter small permease [Pseudomonadales bacterium]|nr:TRAP transporter small permease [Pseudomonadales bacterium]